MQLGIDCQATLFPDKHLLDIRLTYSPKMINFAYGAKTQHGRLTYFLGFVYVARFQAFRINSKRLILLSVIDGSIFLFPEVLFDLSSRMITFVAINHQAYPPFTIFHVIGNILVCLK